MVARPIQATATVAITAVPAATISYTGTPFCSTVSAVPVTFSGTTGGIYTSLAGLAINSTTGVISPVASTGGVYTITYTMAARGGCSQQTATTDITITDMPNATIAYPDSPLPRRAGNNTCVADGHCPASAERIHLPQVLYLM